MKNFLSQMIISLVNISLTVMLATIVFVIIAKTHDNTLLTVWIVLFELSETIGFVKAFLMVFVFSVCSDLVSSIVGQATKFLTKTVED